MKRYPATLVGAYEAEGRAKGLTVAEWEKAVSLPPFSVYPEARLARSMSDRSFFMYRNATDEERRILNAEAGGATGRTSLRSAGHLRVVKAKKNARDRERYHEKKVAA